MELKFGNNNAILIIVTIAHSTEPIGRVTYGLCFPGFLEQLILGESKGGIVSKAELHQVPFVPIVPSHDYRLSGIRYLTQQYLI